MTEAVTLERIHEDLEFLKNTVAEIKEDISELRDIGIEVRPEYLEKLKRIRKEKGVPFKDVNELREIIEK